MVGREHLRISAKILGELAQPYFCPRCFWLKMKTGNKFPFQIFPGIFSSIDAYTKRVVHGWFEDLAEPPLWLRDIGNIVGYIDPPHWSRFQMRIQEHDILLTGAATEFSNLLTVRLQSSTIRPRSTRSTREASCRCTRRSSTVMP